MIVHTIDIKAFKVVNKMSQSENLKLAQRGAYLSLVVYIILSVSKYITGFVLIQTVRADALNNMTDIIVSIAVIVGLKISIKPADKIILMVI